MNANTDYNSNEYVKMLQILPLLLALVGYSETSYPDNSYHYTINIAPGARVCTLIGASGQGGNNCIEQNADAKSNADNGGGDGTITDTSTGLMWKRCSEGQNWNGTTCQGTAVHDVWNRAMPGGQQTDWGTYAGYNDWRVPTGDELKSLLNCNKRDNANDACIDIATFPNTPAKGFWSASTNNAGLVLVADFGFGIIIPNPRGSIYHVRLVRQPH